MKLSPISLAVLPLLTMFSAQAAVYQIVELEPINKVRATSGVATTAQGNTLVNGSTFLDFPLDLSAIDFTNPALNSFLTEQQIADAINGNVDANTKALLLSFLANSPIVTSQPVGTSRIFSISQNGAVTDLVVRDRLASRTNTEFGYGLNAAGQVAAIATAPATKGRFTPTPAPLPEGQPAPEIPVIPQPFTVWNPEPGFMLGYVVSAEQSILLPPAFTELGGGFSAAQDVNNNGLAVGFTSTGVTDAIRETISVVCDGLNQPLQFCLNQAMATRSVSLSTVLGQLRAFQTIDAISQGYQERAAIWQVNSDNTASLVKTLGFLGEKGLGNIAPAVEEVRAPEYFSRASAVNDAGIVVGYSVYSDADRIIRFFDGFGFEVRRIYSAPHATIFQGDEVKGFIDPKEWIASLAIDINNNNVVTGYALRNINSGVRPKMFTYHIDRNELKFNDGFFNSSGTEPRSLNNNGQVVGRGEVVIGGTITRRFHGFVYDSRTDVFRDINDLLGCDAPYTIVDAHHINDNGEIIATALINRTVFNVNGEPLRADDGTIIRQEQATAVKLRPIPNGQPATCGNADQSYERKGGALSNLWLLLLASLPWIRRRRRS